MTKGELMGFPKLKGSKSQINVWVWDLQHIRKWRDMKPGFIEVSMNFVSVEVQITALKVTADINHQR
jgi:hypothetical protein